MKAIILAAGRGSRMLSLTDNKPKCMVELHEKTLLEWQLEAIHKANIHDIGIITGYMSELLANKCDKEFHNPNWSSTNMVMSLTYASEWLRSEPCIVSYSDIFYEYTAIELLQHSKAKLAITYDKNWLDIWMKRFDNPLEDAETFILDSSGNLAEIGNRAESLNEIEGQYMGLLYFTPESWLEVERILNSLPLEKRNKLDMTKLLQSIIEGGNIPVTPVSYDGTWGEIDSEKDLISYL